MICLFLLAALLSQSPAAVTEDSELEIRVIYDNTSARDDVPADWGFSTVITFRDRRVLFDSGTKPDLFLENLGKLDVAPASIEQAVISHQHPDHRNGIYKLYQRRPELEVHFLKAFYEKAYAEAAAVGLEPNRVTDAFEVMPGVYSTGLMDGNPPEQSLAIETSQGIVLVVGCSHPGIVKIVEKVERQRRAESILLVLGGFHMFQQSADEIGPQIAALQKLNVKRVMPAHCSGDLAKQLFEQAYGSNFEPLGAGKVVTVD